MLAVLGGTIVSINLISPTAYAYEFSHVVTEVFSFTSNISEISNFFHIGKVI